MAVEANDREVGLAHLGLRDRVLSLRSMDTLASLDFAGLAIIAEHTQPRQWASGETIYREGEPIREVHIVTDGVIRISRNGAHFIDVERGYGAGFLSVLANDKKGVEATAVGKTRTLALPAEVLIDSFEHNFSLLRNALRLSAHSVLERRNDLPTSEIVTEADPGVFPERPRTFVERIIEMRKNPVLASANVDAAVEMARRSPVIHGSAGDVLFSIGDPSSFYLHLEYGRVACTNAAGDSTVVGAGFILGVMEALAAVPRRFGAVAETDYIIVRIELETMLAIFDAHFALGMGLVTSLARLLLGLSD